MDGHGFHSATQLPIGERLAMRAQAEARFASQPETPSAEELALLPKAVQHLLHELRLHQIELEMQNIELRRTQTERDLADARYFDFYDLAPVGYAAVNEQGFILHANLTAAGLLGVPRSKLAAQAFSRFIDREDQDTYYLLRRQLFETGTAQSCELRMRKLDGSQFFARIDAVVASGDDGAPNLRLVLVDISASKEATAPRVAINQDILDSVNAEILVLDQQGVIRLVNEPWQRFVLENGDTPGLPPPHTGIGTNYLAVCQKGMNSNVSLQYATAAYDGIRAVLTGAMPSFKLDYPCHSPTEQRWFSMCALPLGKSAQVGITITHTDITAHKRAEEEIRIAAVAFESQEGIVVMDGQRQILRVNRAFTEISGYHAQELLGKNINLLHSRQHPESFYEDIWRETDHEGWERGERWIQHKNGSDLFAQGTTTALKDQQGKTTHYVITLSDQTLKHQQNQQRVQHEAAHREALVREVHHRIKNNLQGIGGLLQMFANQKPEIAEQIQLVAGHLNGISVIHGLQGSNGMSRVRLCELTCEIAQATGLIWQTDIAVEIPSNWIFRVVAEKEAVSMALVLNELLVNAIKHGGKAQGHVRVALRQGAGKEGVELTILNAGYLRHKKDCLSAQHHGLTLIESLRPRMGVTVTLAQLDDQVLTSLQLTAPVIALDTEP